MGIMDWFKQIAGAEPVKAASPAPAAPASPDERGAEIAGLNFKSAVDAHMKWKIRLESYINGTSTEDLKVDVVCRDDQCPLGKWIYGRGGGEFGYSETFFDMKAHHSNFHRCAGAVLLSAQAGDKAKALDLLHHGDYVRASERVKKLLAKLFVLVADGNTAIDAHVKWKERLQNHITGRSTEILTMDTVVRDDLCSLGVWLAGEGRQHYGHLPAFQAVQQAHRRFHQAASEVLATAGKGRPDEALRMMEEGDYVRASDDVTVALVDIFSQRQN
jgi:hypothetical protein